MGYGYSITNTDEKLIEKYVLDRPTWASSTNMRYDGNIIYSYGLHAPIGRYIERRSMGKNNMGLNLIHREWLISDKHYSRTTRTHISELTSLIARGIRNGNPIMCLNVLADNECEHKDNVKAMLSDMDCSMRKARACRLYLESHVRAYERKRLNLHSYCALFKLNVPRTMIAANDKKIQLKAALRRLNGQPEALVFQQRS